MSYQRLNFHFLAATALFPTTNHFTPLWMMTLVRLAKFNVDLTSPSINPHRNVTMLSCIEEPAEPGFGRGRVGGLEAACRRSLSRGDGGTRALEVLNVMVWPRSGGKKV